MSHFVYQLEPLFLSKIWGGTQFRDWYSLPDEDLKIGEVWVASALPEGDCTVHGQGKPLSTFLKENKDLFPLKTERLPFHITLIDAKRDLSIQVHPDDQYAQEKGLTSGLSEAWVVLKAMNGSKIELGHKATSKTELIQKVQSNQWDQILNYYDVKSKDLFFIPAGTIHAIGGGLLIYEISQSVDVTYRLYDYNRIDMKTGKLRELHVEDALNVICAPDRYTYDELHFEPKAQTEEVQLLFEKKDLFRLAMIKSASPFIKLQSWGFLTVIEGEGTLDTVNIKCGDTVLIGKHSDKLSMSGTFTGIFASCYD